MDISRVVVWFSAGVTSAWALREAVAEYRGRLPVHAVNTDTGSEDEDNYRFMQDACSWLGVPLEIIKNEKYVDTFAVYDETKFFLKPGIGAKCTFELKRKMRMRYQNLATDLQVFGYDADEGDRAEFFVKNNPEVRAWFPLVEKGITKLMARQMLLDAGIREPRTYEEGFRNANCLNRGCVKGGVGYWNFMRRARPQVFEAMARKERELGFCLLRLDKYVDGKRTKVDVFLDELDPSLGNYKMEPSIVCGLFCGADVPPAPKKVTAKERRKAAANKAYVTDMFDLLK